MTEEQESIPHICHRHHRRCLCKNFLSGVNFSRLGEKLHTCDFFMMCVSWFVSARGLIEDVWKKLNETRFSL